MLTPSKYLASAYSARMPPKTPDISTLDVDAASNTTSIHV
jgi:hypothetical protein